MEVVYCDLASGMFSWINLVGPEPTFPSTNQIVGLGLGRGLGVEQHAYQPIISLQFKGQIMS